MRPFEERRRNRSFELFMQLGYVADVLVLAAWGNPLAKAIVNVPDEGLSDELDHARAEYAEIERRSRVRRQLERRRGARVSP